MSHFAAAASAAAELARRAPGRALVVLFAVWKALLLAVAAATVLVADRGYDTSTTLGPTAARPAGSAAESALDRLTRWDAIYFVHVARHGYVYEQEYAFGPGLPFLARAFAGGLAKLPLSRIAQPPEALAAVVVSHAAHLASVLALYGTHQRLWPASMRRRPRAFAAAALHVLSPAGLFLSAPYAEASCSALSFTGYALLALSLTRAGHNPSGKAQASWIQRVATNETVLTLAAGLLFGLATAFRSNAILNGAPFAGELLWQMARLWFLLVSGGGWRQLVAIGRRMCVLVVAGLCVAAGSAVPQFVVWKIFCGPDANMTVSRPWCQGLVPSVYSFVQAENWNVGFLRYWKRGNLPLFLLAAPMLLILAVSGVSIIRDNFSSSSQKQPTVKPHRPPDAPSPEPDRARIAVLSVAAAQVLLAVLAFTTYHVQIITRIASASPLWYWWVADLLCGGNNNPSDSHSKALQRSSFRDGRVVVRWAVVYAMVQAVLYANFMPPA